MPVPGSTDAFLRSPPWTPASWCKRGPVDVVRAVGILD